MNQDPTTLDGYPIFRCAFPDGIAEEDYPVVIRVMNDRLSKRTSAQMLTVLTGKSFDQTLHDVRTTLDAIDHDPSRETVGTPRYQAILDRLAPCGYAAWRHWLPNTPFPGTRLPHDTPVKDAFLQRYRSRDVTYRSQARTSTLFDPDLPSAAWHRYEDVLAVLADPVFDRYPVLYVYWEQHDTYATTMTAIWTFMEDKNPWEEDDRYIFPPDLDWCIATTHDDYLIAVGSIVPLLTGDAATPRNPAHDASSGR